MAILFAQTSFNLRAINLNNTVSQYVGNTFLPGFNYTIPPVNMSGSYLGISFSYNYPGQTVQDAYGIHWGSAPNTTLLAGTSFTVDGAGNLNGGTLQLASDTTPVSGGGSVQNWSIADFSMPVVNAIAAANSAGTADDLAIFKTALSGNDVIDMSTQNDRAWGFGGNDIMSGNGGRDRLYGGAGTDFLDGGNGNDRLYGGTGNDYIGMDSGNDLINGGRGHDAVVLFDGAASGPSTVNSTIDLRITGPQNTGFGMDTLVSIEDIYGGAGKDQLIGNGKSNLIKGGAGNDRIAGNGGADQLYGNGGRDQLKGGNGNDMLNGGGGHDRLNGGNGNDSLTGGGGADQFIFKGGAMGQDTVTDFADNTDQLVLHSSIWGGGTMTAAAVVSTYASVSGADLLLDFGNGNSITLTGLGHLGTAILDNDITII